MNIAKRIEIGANLATIVVAALFGWVVVRGGVARPALTTGSGQASGPKVGLDLKQSLKDVDFAANKQTLVLGLQTTCHFCTESGPFFQKLSAAANGATKIVAVLPQSVDDSQKYLSKLGVHMTEVKSAPLSSIGVNGTPTLLLADDKGIVKQIWIGKLADAKQSEVLSAISPKISARLGGL